MKTLEPLWVMWFSKAVGVTFHVAESLSCSESAGCTSEELFCSTWG